MGPYRLHVVYVSVDQVGLYRLQVMYESVDQVGVLSQSYPVVSFQESQTKAVYDRLSQLIRPYITAPDMANKATDKAKAASKDQKTHSFQVR